MKNDKKYEELYQKFVDYEEKEHIKNQQKIKVGLKLNILIPMVFLLLCFLTDGSKLLFLIMWIVLLFGIAFYLMRIEYTDYKNHERLENFGIKDINWKNDDLVIPEEDIEKYRQGLEEFNQKIENISITKIDQKIDEKIDQRIDKIFDVEIDKPDDHDKDENKNQKKDEE